MGKFRIGAGGLGLLLLGAGFMITRAQDPVEEPTTALDRAPMNVSDPSCTFFGPQREKFLKSMRPFSRGEMTAKIAGGLAGADDVMNAFRSNGLSPAGAGTRLPVSGGSVKNPRTITSSNTIDRYIFDALSVAGVAAAPDTTDFEFVRRAYLDLTGRIPNGTQVLAFVNDTDPAKRDKLVDSLIGTEQWADKWTIWFGDLLKNNSRNTQIPRFVPGVVAFNNYIRSSLTGRKPYNQMVRELISAQGSDSWTQGELGFIIGGQMQGGPMQDVFDEQLAKTMDTFMGISHMECLLCHNGRGHLDSLSLFGYYATRSDAWGMASFMSHTQTERTPVAGAVNGNPYYWFLRNNVNTAVVGGGQQPGPRYNFTNDYALNTTTGNRPARTTQANAFDQLNTLTSTPRMKPKYIFDGTSPAAGQDYRTFLAQKITGDFQFARATVNYFWEYFFEIGLVNPSNQFDPERQDPDHPPTDCPPKTPCTLQASNPRLLNALAQDFINSGYDIRALQKEIVTSRAYQLSSRYDGTWNPANQNLFARKLVRRLWSEEIHDAVAQSSNIIPTYTGPIREMGSPVAAWGPVNWAMKFPEPVTSPGPGSNLQATAAFLDAFLRGNRDDEDRKSEGSISQALALMNDNFIMPRVRSTAATSLIQTALKLPDDQMVTSLYLNVLSRYPTQTELATALANLRAPNNRNTEAQNLLWSLYNSVSFTFNY